MSHRKLLAGIGALIILAVAAAAAVSLIAGTFPFDRTPPRISVVIDAGHGGRDPGVVVDGVYEADVNLDIAVKVAEALAVEPDLDVIMTRRLDVSTSHEERVEVAKRSAAVVYVSVQANACDRPNVTGVETWVDDGQGPGSESWMLAELIQDSLVTGTGSRDRGVRSMGLYFGRLECAAVLVETGFLTSRDERDKLLTGSYQDTVARSIADGVRAFVEHTIAGRAR